jgi:hypothetical protein
MRFATVAGSARSKDRKIVSRLKLNGNELLVADFLIAVTIGEMIRLPPSSEISSFRWTAHRL